MNAAIVAMGLKLSNHKVGTEGEQIEKSCSKQIEKCYAIEHDERFLKLRCSNFTIQKLPPCSLPQFTTTESNDKRTQGQLEEKRFLNREIKSWLR